MNSAAVLVVVSFAVFGSYLALLLLGTGDARLRGRSPWLWGAVLVLGGPPGWGLWAVVAVLDRLRGRRGLVDPRGARRLETTAAVLATAALASALALGAFPVSVAVAPLVSPGPGAPPGERATVSCGAAALVIAGASGPATSRGMGGYAIGAGGDGGSTLDREIAACAAQAGRRVALAWALFAAAAFLLGVPLLEARAVVRGGGATAVPPPPSAGRSLAFRLGSAYGARASRRHAEQGSP